MPCCAPEVLGKLPRCPGHDGMLEPKVDEHVVVPKVPVKNLQQGVSVKDQKFQ